MKRPFLSLTQGSAIRRIGIKKWRRNLAIAMGNASYDAEIVASLQARHGEDALVDAHIEWALGEQESKRQRIDVTELPTGTRRLVRIIEKGLPRDA